MSGLTLILFVVGLGLLLAGAHALVHGAAKLATSLGVSPLVIGLTVVGFGTSSPELAASIQAALAHQPGIALGNVVGSNILNILLILGVAAIVTPLTVQRQLIRLDVPIMIGVSVLVPVFGLDGRVGRVEGVILVIGFVLYTAFSIHWSRREMIAAATVASTPIAVPRGKFDGLTHAALVVAGLAMLVLGARWLVNGAVALAQSMGVSELVIGLTVVALGTSLPEVATSIVASLRGQRDIAVGNVVGSNIFNILTVLGMASLVSPRGIEVSEAALKFDIPVMIAVAVVCLPMFFTGAVIMRWEGAVLLGYYVAYTLYLLLASSRDAAAPLVGKTLWLFVIPLTILGLGISLVNALVRRPRMPAAPFNDRGPL